MWFKIEVGVSVCVLGGWYVFLVSIVIMGLEWNIKYSGICSVFLVVGG